MATLSYEGGPVSQSTELRDEDVTLHIFTEEELRLLIKQAQSARYNEGDEFSVVISQCNAPIDREVSYALTQPVRTFEIVEITENYVSVEFHDNPDATCPISRDLFERLLKKQDIQLERTASERRKVHG